MPLRINTNTPASIAQRLLRTNNEDAAARLERLSSALRVNRAADDAAGLSASERFRAQVSGFAQAVRNSELATHRIQSAEGGLNQVNSILIRMRELAVRGASSTLSGTDRSGLQTEFAQLSAEIDRIAGSTPGLSDAGTALEVPTGDGTGAAIRVDLPDARASGPALNLGGASVGSFSDAGTAVSAVDRAISTVVRQRGDLGAVQNRLAFNIRATETALENTQASESTIRDADVAAEATALVRAQLLSRSSAAVTAQAHILPQRALSLLT